MNKISKISQYLLGISLLVFGTNGFFQFIPAPEFGAEAVAYFQGLGKIMIVVKALEIVCGLLILSGRFTVLGLSIFAPILANIIMFHLFYALDSLVPGLVLSVFWGILVYQHRKNFAGLMDQPEVAS